MSYVLGLDLGTSSLKGILVSRKGRIVAEASSEYPVFNPALGFSEQNPEDWVKAAKNVIRQILIIVPDAKKNIEGISFSGQMHSLVLLDGRGKPLRKAILWNDVRTTLQCAKIDKILKSDIFKITGNRALQGFTLPKILWVMENEPDIWAESRVFMLPKDYLGFYFTGNKYMEFSDAAGTLMLDIAKKEWSSAVAKAFNIPEYIYPKLIDSIAKTGVIRKEVAAELGIENDVSVYAGGADNACAAAGAGILQEKTGMCSIGTSGVFLAYEGKEIKYYKGKLHFFNHIIKDNYYSMGVTLAAGSSLSWLKNTFAKNADFDGLLEEINKIPPGSEGLLFSPYITGERTPYADAEIRGSFIGIDIKHTLGHFTRAVMEGIVFSLKDSMGLMNRYADKKFERVISVGGGAKNKDWLQMQADIFNSKITTLRNEQGPSLGAAMIAAVGIGWYKTFEDCAEDFVSYGKIYEPDIARVKKYEKVYELYDKIYYSTQEICKNRIL
ncbi:MAG: xylulokinase [Elusimicrobiota bacterium]|jgi:xylulokinase|nr:xylulokinase [Elusimicrobiota bacterium]